jgi:mannose-6-phosphate isomerase-like protein (cupin superfamily)
MAHAGLILDNPISGERFIFTDTAGETGGELLAFELEVPAGGRVPGAHVHPSQEERFEVVSGTMRFRRGLRSVTAEAGDSLVVPPGTSHRFANAGDELARIRVEVRPALEMERLFETVAGLARDGRTFAGGMPKPLELALFMRRFEEEVEAPVAPKLVRVVMKPLAWMGRRRGLDARYRATELPELKASRPAPTRPTGSVTRDRRPGATHPSPSRPGPSGRTGGAS